MPLPTVTLTTDGAARGNPGPGGWAALLEANGKEKLVVGEEPMPTTNNAMELRAVIGGLDVLKKPCAVMLRADSQYVLQGLERLRAGAGLPEKNRELWARLLALSRVHSIHGQWVRGHSGDLRNERVNEAANQAAARAYQRAESARPEAAPTGAWVLALLSPAAGRPVQWLVQAGAERRSGAQPVARGVTQPTAIYQALVAALDAAGAMPGAADHTLVVRSNYELIVKQGRGEWKVRQPEQQPLADQVAALRRLFAEVRFEHAPTDALLPLFAEAAP
ncbi:reverse transcriptase-like protein [Chloroflexia bacterium SDU3-3]|nr:reverse transcriptase-like protein [Chloroflexia bacterium SDU3-3]